MNPFIVHKRDSIKLGPWKDEDIRKGAVVLAEGNSGLYVIHRVIKRNGDDLTLSGDGNLIQTETTTTAKVIAVMHSITRKGREYSSSSLVWRLYSGIWMFLAPVRRYPLGIWRRLK